MTLPLEQELLDEAPDWLLFPVPPNARRDEALMAKVTAWAGDPEHLEELYLALSAVRATRCYAPAANFANAGLYRTWQRWLGRAPPILLAYACAHMTHPAMVRVLRRLAKHPDIGLRRNVWKRLKQQPLHEVALPDGHDGDWNERGWLHGTRPRRNLVVPRSAFFKARDDDGGEARTPGTGEATRDRPDLPRLDTVGALRELLEIRSPKQLGWFLLARAGEGLPYQRFEIPKRDGTPREIHAPCAQLRHAQRRLLDQVLARVPTHDCAHGFVPGRSTVTNARPHLGQRVVVKFDLVDFFPSIGFARVVGLFHSLGFPGNAARFAADDDSRRVSATMARLCVRAPDADNAFTAHCPQGAPTSPAISNLVCRRLDARCAGLAASLGGVYTRYADDLTFSFAEEPERVGRLRWWVDQICQQEGFATHPRKFRVIRASRRQSVTGLVVNEALRIPRPARRRFRAMLHDAQRNGLEAAGRGRPGFGHWLHGFAAYLHMVHPEEGVPALEAVRALLDDGRHRTVDGDAGSAIARQPGQEEGE